jgi:hypothetical protein
MRDSLRGLEQKLLNTRKANSLNLSGAVMARWNRTQWCGLWSTAALRRQLRPLQREKCRENAAFWSK